MLSTAYLVTYIAPLTVVSMIVFIVDERILWIGSRAATPALLTSTLIVPSKSSRARPTASRTCSSSLTSHGSGRHRWPRSSMAATVAAIVSGVPTA